MDSDFIEEAKVRMKFGYEILTPAQWNIFCFIFLRGKVIPVPHYKGKLIRKGTIRAIIREIGVSVKDFFD